MDKPSFLGVRSFGYFLLSHGQHVADAPNAQLDELRETIRELVSQVKRNYYSIGLAWIQLGTLLKQMAPSFPGGTPAWWIQNIPGDVDARWAQTCGRVVGAFSKSVVLATPISKLDLLLTFCRWLKLAVPKDDPGAFVVRWSTRQGDSFERTFDDCKLQDLSQAVAYAKRTRHPLKTPPPNEAVPKEVQDALDSVNDKLASIVNSDDDFALEAFMKDRRVRIRLNVDAELFPDVIEQIEKAGIEFSIDIDPPDDDEAPRRRGSKQPRKPRRKRRAA